MPWLRREKRKIEYSLTTFAGTLAAFQSQLDWEPQRTESRAKMVLYTLDDRMRVFGPMMQRVSAHLESETAVSVVHPKNVVYGAGDPYFPTYEWHILPTARIDADARRLTLSLRASPGSTICEIMVYYLLTYTDQYGDEHPMHRLPTDFRNEPAIKALLLDTIKTVGL